MSSFRACKNLDEVNENIKIQNQLSIVSEKIHASNGNVKLCICFKRSLKFVFASFEIGENLLVRKFGAPFYNMSRINFKDKIYFDTRNDANSHFHRFLLAAPSFNTFREKSTHCVALLERIGKFLIMAVLLN